MRTPRIAILATATIAALLLAACGADGSATSGTAARDDGTTTIDVVMTDMAFTPTAVQLSAGDTVRFRFRNDGQAIHEAVIGDVTFQEEHAAEMAAMGSANAPMNHTANGEVGPLVVQPGETGELIYTATSAGSLLIGCHQPGHWEFGMKATIEVV
ncbi:MAG: cupredoxin domain-containing protein [Actinobacteria bacterium]|nr:cupredoxin domain-containing protein [Actinomycetota bacterium]